MQGDLNCYTATYTGLLLRCSWSLTDLDSSPSIYQSTKRSAARHPWRRNPETCETRVGTWQGLTPSIGLSTGLKWRRWDHSPVWLGYRGRVQFECFIGAWTIGPILSLKFAPLEDWNSKCGGFRFFTWPPSWPSVHFHQSRLRSLSFPIYSIVTSIAP